MFKIGTPISSRPVTTIHMAQRQLTHMFATMSSLTRKYPVKRVLREQADQARPLERDPGIKCIGASGPRLIRDIFLVHPAYRQALPVRLQNSPVERPLSCPTGNEH
jgi:hypothetical protein